MVRNSSKARKEDSKSEEVSDLDFPRSNLIQPLAVNPMPFTSGANISQSMPVLKDNRHNSMASIIQDEDSKNCEVTPCERLINHILVSYFTSLSRQEEFEGNSKRIIPLFSITYFLSIFFSITSCMRFDCVRNKVWVASLGVVSGGLAVLSGFGLLLFCRMKFAINTANAPFLILGIGVDDMFIMLSSWQKTKVKDKVGDRLAETYAEAAVSITITTLTDVLAFYIGILTPFRSVQSFCVYTGTTILFCFLYNITFFGAVLALNGRREASNRHWLTFRKVERDPKPDESKCYAMCCVGEVLSEVLMHCTLSVILLSRELFQRYWVWSCWPLQKVTYSGHFSKSCFSS
ncbi:patched domain-containing protein 3-like [Scyliorhinus torazame]|uniref:patched domain-containing protein 3-like n=1 Tax=Scyliorhinus torazame TaxID=75743 RepID=UPI003B5A1216